MSDGMFVKVVVMQKGWEEPRLGFWVVAAEDPVAAVEAVRRHGEPDWEIEVDGPASAAIVWIKGRAPGQAVSI